MSGASDEDVIRSLRSRSIEGRNAWVVEVAKDAMHAFEWCIRPGLKHTCMVIACDHALKAIENGADIREHALKQVVTYAAYVPASTGMIDVEVRAYSASAWTDILRSLEMGLCG